MVLAGSLVASEAFASKMVVNEMLRDGTWGPSGTEWVEFVLLEDLTAQELEQYYVGDSSPATAAKHASYQFANLAQIAAEFPAGTLLVITGGAALSEDTAFDPVFGDFTLVLSTTGLHLVSNGVEGDLGQLDVVYVDTDGTLGGATLALDGFALSTDSDPGPFGALANVLVDPTPHRTALANLDDVALASVTTSWAAAISSDAATPGLGNGTVNTASIDALRAQYQCPDADADAICDVLDRCPVDADPQDVDHDLDGIGDACDACVDVDGDALCSGLDLCPATFDPTNEDLDLDGVGDVCDPCVDIDADAVCDAADLCPLLYDPTNDDLDLDGVGDACDACVDIDADAVCDELDLCPLFHDPSNEDADFDAIGDACDACVDIDADAVCAADDLCPVDFDPNNVDGDLDGIGDVCDDPITLLDAVPGTAGVANTFTVINGPANTQADFFYGGAAGSTNVPGCPGLTVAIKNPVVLGNVDSDSLGTATVSGVKIPAGAAGKKLRVQVVFAAFCLVSNVDVTQF